MTILVPQATLSTQYQLHVFSVPSHYWGLQLVASYQVSFTRQHIT